MSRFSLHLTALIFFLSGNSALIFEALWFRAASQVLGSSVYSAAAVLMAFMVGLGLGSATLALWGARLRRPFRLYIIIECSIAVSGIATIYLLPLSAPWLASAWVEQGAGLAELNVGRFLLAWLILVFPAFAMGATLAVLQKALHHCDDSFSRSMGHLYGWNTVGAVVGTLLAEFVLIHHLGLERSAWVAAALNVVAALLICRYFNDDTNEPQQAQLIAQPEQQAARWLLVAPFVAGFVLLALGVVWFRYIMLFQVGSSHIYSVMLALVLSGLAIGGLLAMYIETAGWRLLYYLKLLPLLSLVMVAMSYAFFQFVTVTQPLLLFSSQYVFIAPAAVLMLPVSIISGMLFPLFGEWLFRAYTVNTKASGALTAANALGAVLGCAVAMFYLLPYVGIEASILVLVVLYGVLALVVALIEGPKTGWVLLPLTCIAVALTLFPLGSLHNSYEKVGKFRYKGETLALVKEGLNATLRYYRTDYLDQPLSYRLVSNSYSMSNSNAYSQRYMELFVYLPYALHPKIQDVLQIGYGVGNTAEAVVSLQSMQSFDVVDVSADILKHSELVHQLSGIYPLADDRATAHVEDGRFYLQTHNKQYDLITGEPPPPKMAGISNLYSQEYFALIKQRLKPQGLVSYWLPAHNLYASDSLAILKAFCLEFSDCSLWNGGGLDWIMLGSKGGIAKVKPYQLSALWRGKLAASLNAIGIENPGQLGALFMADSAMLKALTADVEPVTDNFPQRISPDFKGVLAYSPVYDELLNIQNRKKAFWDSEFIDHIFYPTTQKKGMPAFNEEGIVTAYFLQSMGYLKDVPVNWQSLSPIIAAGKSKNLALLWYGLDRQKAKFLENGQVSRSHPDYLNQQARWLMFKKEYRQAAALLKRYLPNAKAAERSKLQQMYYVARAEVAGGVDAALVKDMRADGISLSFQQWLKAAKGSAL